MISSQPKNNPAKLFEALTLEFTSGLRLQFELFDFSLAQRWASLLSASMNIQGQRWETSAPPPYRNILQDELEFLLLSLSNRQESADFLRGLEKSEGVYTNQSLEKIIASPIFNQEAITGSRQEEILQRARNIVPKLVQASFRKRKGRVSGISIFPKLPRKRPFSSPHPLSQSIENEDFKHFQIDRLPGGIRLHSGGPGISANTAANTRDFHTPPSPFRFFTPRFLLDLSPSYPPLSEWDDYQALLCWSKKVQFDLSDKRNWADNVYVGRLCGEDMARLGKIADEVAISKNLSVKSFTLVPAAKGKWNLHDQ